MAIIPLAQPLPVGSSDLPGSFGRAALITLPYLVLHREEFAWPRMSPHAPVRSYFKPVWAAPLHPSPAVSDLRSQNLIHAGWSVFCCTCRQPILESEFQFRIGRPAVS